MLASAFAGGGGALLPFSHRKHAELPLACIDCHATATKGPRAGFPRVSGCMLCHEEIAKEKPAIRRLAALAADATPFERSEPLADFVIFSHARHMAAADQAPPGESRGIQPERGATGAPPATPARGGPEGRGARGGAAGPGNQPSDDAPWKGAGSPAAAAARGTSAEMEARCTQCHGAVRRIASSAIPAPRSMKDCVDCHKRTGATIVCLACHDLGQ